MLIVGARWGEEIRQAAFLDRLAGVEMLGALERLQLRRFVAATLVGKGATRMEGAARGRINRRGQLALDRQALAALTRIGARAACLRRSAESNNTYTLSDAL